VGAAGVAGNGQWGADLRLADPYAFNLPLRIGATARHRDGAEPVYRVHQPLAPRPDDDDFQLLRYQRTGGELGGGFFPLPLIGIFLDAGYEYVDAGPIPAGLTNNPLRPGSSHHPYLRLSFDHDTRDNPLAPTRGYRLSLALTGSTTASGSDYDYLKAVIRTAYHKPIRFGSSGHVVRFEIFGGYIVGDAPFYERFFVGDVSALVPARDLDLNFASRPLPDFFRQGAGGLGYETVLAGTSVEYAIPIFRGHSPLYRVEFFLGSGVFGMTSPSDPADERRASLGVRTNPGEANPSAFPLDLTFDAGFRAETPVGVFGLSFANALSLVPF
jgi:outer membrane protein assembly factor BamA